MHHPPQEPEVSLIRNRKLAFALVLAATPSFAAEGSADQPTNAEMTAIFDADQQDRQGPVIDGNTVGQKDDIRRKRTQALLDTDALNSGDDFYHAAFVFQHGGTPDDYLKAHLLATVAIARGKADATWIAAATLDRYLQAIGKPQILGTQFRVGSDGRATQEPFDRILGSDSLRAALGVPPLAKQEERRTQLEKEPWPKPVIMPVPSLQRLAPAPAARTFTATAQPVRCRPIPASETLLGRARLRWIVVGEIHGTTETPDAFGDLVCLASASKPVTVAVEQATSEQPAIDDFIGSDGGPEATSRFLSSRIWTQTVKDGRSSEAYFKLFQRLRELRTAGRITSVVAFQPLYNPGPGGFNPGRYENALAASLLSTSPKGTHVLVLVGNAHAMRVPPVWAKPPYLPMAGYLPAGETVNLDARWNGGSYWACTSATDCGPQTASSPPIKLPRGITMDAPNGPFTGSLNLGVEVTASSPQGQATQ